MSKGEYADFQIFCLCSFDQIENKKRMYHNLYSYVYVCYAVCVRLQQRLNIVWTARLIDVCNTCQCRSVETAFSFWKKIWAKNFVTIALM